MKKITLAIVLVLSLCLTAIGYSQPARQDNKPGRPMMKMAGMQKMEIFKKLNLTDQQKGKIGDLKIAFQKKMIDLKADLQKSKLDLKELRQKSELNRNDVIAAVEKINKSRDAISIAVANHMMDVYEVLTPEQQKIWKENAPNFKMMRRGHRMMQHQMMWK